MFEFAWPWLFLILPLPWLLRIWLPPARVAPGSALRVPFLKDFLRLEQNTTRRRLPYGLLLMAALAWLLLVVAAARPQWLADMTDIPVTGRDLLLAVDLSRSMEQNDMPWRGETVDRLTAVKRVAGEFIDRRVGDRLGLILFGERPYLQTPLTFDHQTVKTLLDEAQIGIAGDSTAIGDAIGLALKRLRKTGHTHAVLVLLTDGANTTGEIEPLQAAEMAARQGIRIYTIGIGADVEARGLFGFLQHNPGQDLDEKTLAAIASTTGGRYFRARDFDELSSIYRLLDQIEPAAQDPKRYRPVTPLFYLPLSLALLLSLLIFLQQTGVYRYARN
jgi:Ca-activated chloride channel family protein